MSHGQSMIASSVSLVHNGNDKTLLSILPEMSAALSNDNEWQMMTAGSCGYCNVHVNQVQRDSTTQGLMSDKCTQSLLNPSH